MPQLRANRFQVFRRNALDSLPDQTWLVPSYLPDQGVAVMGGKEGIGKSFVVIDLGASVSTATDWLGIKVTQGPVVYFAGEGERGAAKRLCAWESYHGVQADDMSIFVGRPQLAAPAEVEKAIALIEADGIRPALCTIDTLSTHNTGRNENDAADMSLALEGARVISEHFGCCVLLVHHHGKNGELRGSSTLGCNCDGVLSLKETNVEHQITLTSDKIKDDGEPPEVIIDLMPHYFEYRGKEAKSLVPNLGQAVDIDLFRKLSQHESTILKLLAAGPKRRSEMVAAGIPEGSIDEALRRLRDLKHIAKGPGHRDPYSLCPIDPIP